MATYSYVDVDIKEARTLADLNGVAIDLESVRGLSKYLEDRFALGNIDVDMVDAFSTAILVRYARPFMTGVRKKISPDTVDKLSAHHRQLHEKFMSWRNKHIAHSVNPFEDNQVVAYYNDEKVLSDGFQSISVQQNRLVGLSLADLSELQELTAALLEHVNSRVDEEKAKILGAVRALPVKEALAKGQKPLKVPGLDSVRKRRK